MAPRSEALQEFLESLKVNFAAAKCEPNVSCVVEALFAAIAQPAPAGFAPPSRLPVCRWLNTALTIARSSSPTLTRLASAFEAIEPSLAWMVRGSSGPFASANWLNGHANATIVGPSPGLETRDDVAVGVSLLAPHVRYPDHQHVPEEVYLLLTPGRFQHGESGWFEPGPGQTLHNEPNIKHAMASDESPLLAVWCLLLQ
jgi:quercetin dioxygenase-like cupin family protein